ncbi:hypothetical protein [Sinomonas albida]|uniref:hypothetical protein n=1 Tax=Sinomonas albida TaxID=369942 RepID=UPI003017EDD7
MTELDARPHLPNRRRGFEGLLQCVVLTVATTACGSYADGDQWAGVTITNNAKTEITLDLHRARPVAPGQSTVLDVDSNSNPQQLRIPSADGGTLGCLTFLFHTTSAEKFTVNVSDVSTCSESLRLMSG